MTDKARKWLSEQQPAMTETLKQWANINSGSYNVEGVRKMASTIKEYVEKNLGVEGTFTEVSKAKGIDDQGNPYEREVGPVLTFSCRPEAKVRVLFSGHMDTVFPKDHHFQEWHQIDENTLGGPGVADLKGGLIVMLNAIKAFEQSSIASNIGWDIIFNSDEEIGSLGSAPHLIEATKTTDVGLIYEPSMPDGWLAGARRGSGNYTIIVRGKAAHAGREYHVGRNAIATLAKGMVTLDTLNELRDSVTLNLAKLNGGGPNNIVPDLAMCSFNIRVTTLDDQTFAEQHVQSVVDSINQLDGFECEIHGGFNRSPKPATDQQKKLFELVELCGKELNIELGFRDTGGCCDGNNFLAAGLPNVDTLGVQGGNIHSDQEYMLLDSLVDRAQLSFSILERIATEPEKWLSLDK